MTRNTLNGHSTVAQNVSRFIINVSDQTTNQ
jgi:hypothetical protein